MILLFHRRPLSSVNIVPFHTIMNYLTNDNLIVRSFAFSNLLGNIVIFIPLGVYITVFNRDKRLYKNVIWIIIISLIIEFVQYIMKIGVSDIDDVILNGLGGTIGIAAYKILLLIMKDVKKVRHTIEIMAPIAGIFSFIILYIYNS